MRARRVLRTLPISLIAWSVLLAGSSVAPAPAAGIVSSNWAGYVAAARTGSRFSSVSGSWRAPAVSCTRGHEAFAAVWIGLGGYHEGSSGLEQIGTDASCANSGRASYGAWFELLPAAPVALALRVRPGDALTASVTVASNHVTLRLRDLTTGARFATTHHYSQPDTSSAEWIVEAPSTCVTGSGCHALPLADFGSVSFTSATVISSRHTGTITSPGWSATSLELLQELPQLASGPAGLGLPVRSTIDRATPSAVSPTNGSFSVSYSESTTQAEVSARPVGPPVGPP